MHPFVIGELSMGTLANRPNVLRQLGRIPCLLPARNSDVMALVEAYKIYGVGIGWTDAHLLCSVRLRPDSSLWTRDRRLETVAQRLGIAAG